MKPTILITGASKVDSLGYKIAHAIRDFPHKGVLYPEIPFRLVGVGLGWDPIAKAVFDEAVYSDVSNSEHLASISSKFITEDLYAIINCAGINSNDWLQNVEEEEFDRVMGVNAKAIFLLAKTFQAKLQQANGTILNIISNASHMPMTASLAYNASKGAAHIMTLQLARELTKKDGITVFGISPNKLKGTGMSKDIENNVQRVRGWTPEYAEEYQKQGLLTGEETNPDTLAEFIAFLLSTKQRHKYLSGCILPYGA